MEDFPSHWLQAMRSKAPGFSLPVSGARIHHARESSVHYTSPNIQQRAKCQIRCRAAAHIIRLFSCESHMYSRFHNLEPHRNHTWMSVKFTHWEPSVWCCTFKEFEWCGFLEKMGIRPCSTREAATLGVMRQPKLMAEDYRRCKSEEL